MVRILWIESWLILNIFVFTLVASAFISFVLKYFAIAGSLFWAQYFEAKAKYIKELSKFEGPDKNEDLRSRFN